MLFPSPFSKENAWAGATPESHSHYKVKLGLLWRQGGCWLTLLHSRPMWGRSQVWWILEESPCTLIVIESVSKERGKPKRAKLCLSWFSLPVLSSWYLLCVWYPFYLFIRKSSVFPRAIEWNPRVLFHFMNWAPAPSLNGSGGFQHWIIQWWECGVDVLFGPQAILVGVPNSSHLLLSLCPLNAKWYLFFPASLGFTENSTKCQPQQLVPVQFCQTGGYSQPLCPVARKPMQHLILSKLSSFPCRHHLRVRSTGPSGPLWNVNLTFFYCFLFPRTLVSL